MEGSVQRVRTRKILYLIVIPFMVRTASIPLVSKPELHANVALDAKDKLCDRFDEKELT
jgi:hypothetical protein